MKQQRRKTVVNIPMTSVEESVEKVKRSMEKVVGKRVSYKMEEKQLWEDAHAMAMEKARTLEESLRKGGRVSMRDIYKVGTPCNNVMPSVKNLRMEENGDTSSLEEIEEEQEEEMVPLKSPNLENLYEPTSSQQKRRVSIGSNLDGLDNESSRTRTQRRHENFRHSDSDITRRGSGIIALEDNDVDDILATLDLEESDTN